MIHVLIIHEHPLFRVGLRSTLERSPDLCVVGEAVKYEQLLELVGATQPDVVLFDGALISCQPMYSAAEVVSHLRGAGACGIIVFAPSADEECLFRFLMSGAAAYELPTISGKDLMEKIRRVANGEYLISSEVLRPNPSRRLSRPEEVSMTAPGKQKAHDPSQISEREVTVLKQIVKGRSNKQIAQALGLSDQTVKNHVTSILKKFHVHDRTAAVVMALRQQMISLDDAQPHDLVLGVEALARRAQRFTKPVAAAQDVQFVRSHTLVANG